MPQKVLLKNNLNKTYLFHIGQSAQAKTVGQQMKFMDEKAAERFLRGFGDQGKAGRFKPLLAAANLTMPTNIPPARLLATQLNTGRIKVYLLPSKTKGDGQASGPVVLGKGTDNNRYKIVPAADALMLNVGKPAAVATIQQSLDLLANLNLDAEALKSLSAAPAEGGEVQLDALAEKVAKGELVVVNLGPTPMRRRPIVERSEAATKPVPLAPEVDPWIEIKLVDEEGEPVANQKYTIKDAQGTEYKGSTDDKGVARVNKLAEGNCEICFDDLEGWS